MAKILIIDDSVVARMSVKSCIPKDQGHIVHEAADAASGVAMFISLRPDVTFLDLTMPDTGGLELLEELKRDFPDAVIIVLSADIQKQTVESVNRLGAFAMLNKPPVKELVQSELIKALAAAGVAP